jgi:hypothetical protein
MPVRPNSKNPYEGNSAIFTIREKSVTAIDFLIQVVGVSFHEAMRELTGS